MDADIYRENENVTNNVIQRITFFLKLNSYRLYDDVPPYP